MVLFVVEQVLEGTRIVSPRRQDEYIYVLQPAIDD